MSALRIGVGVLLIASVMTGWAQRVVPTDQQGPADWQDDRWNEMRSGRFQAAIIPLPSGKLIKGLAVQVGDKGGATICYDTTGCRMMGLWQGGLFDYDSRKFGVVESPTPAGPVQEWFRASSQGTTEGVRWLGFHVNGSRLVLKFDAGGREIKEMPWWEDVESEWVLVRTFEISPGEHSIKIPIMRARALTPIPGGERSDGTAVILNSFDREQGVLIRGDLEASRWQLDEAENSAFLEVMSSEVPQTLTLWFVNAEQLRSRSVSDSLGSLGRVKPLGERTLPGAKQWAPLSTRGQRSRLSVAYAIDTLTVPYRNPWNALMFLTGVDFFPSGDAAVSTMHGDVWVVTGITEGLESLSWHRFATGLFQPLGLQVVDGVIHVLGRDQITALQDENGDLFADFYANHSNLIQTRPGHHFVTSLQSDPEGRLYYVDTGGLHRVAADGSSLETIATGWRNPNGMGRSPDGILTVAPQQGQWTPSSQISEVKIGGFYGARGPKPNASRPKGYDPPLCWIPHAVDNSGGSQVWAPASGWGPLSGHMIHLSYGRCSMMVALRDVVNGQPQGGVVPIRGGRFLSGAMRGAVNPKDGQLYVVGAKGWQSSALQDGSLQRVRYTGKSPNVPVGLKVHQNGIALQFSDALDVDWASDVENYGVKQWNYRYTNEYGSKDYSVLDPNREGRDDVEIESIRMSDQGKSVFLVIPGMVPVMQMELRYNLRSVSGGRVRGSLYHTIHNFRPAQVF